MNRLTIILLLVLGMSLTLGCAEQGRIERIVIPADVPEDHPHRYAYTRSVGDNHIHLGIDHPKGKMSVFVEDMSEDLIRLPLKKIDAKITTPDGTVRTLELYATGATRMDSKRLRRRAPYRAYYSKQADWLENIHEFVVEVKIPIEDKIYVVSFDYKISPEEDVHHRHR